MENMKSGRELDALVAEKVMGWKPNYPGGWLHPPRDTSDRKRYLDNDGCTVIPSYSTDIAAALEVLNKLREMPTSSAKDMSAGISVEAVDSGGWWVGWRWHEWTDDGARGETIPEAICLAALKAVGAI